MKLRTVAMLLAGVLTLGGWYVIDLSAKDNAEAQIRALEDQFIKAFNAKDVDGIMKVYVPGDEPFVFDVVPPRQHVGWDAYMKDWQTFLAQLQGPIKVERSELQISTDGGDVAYGHSIQHVTGTMGGKPTEFIVGVTDGYRKVNGKWLIAHEQVSVPVDMETGKPDMMSKP